jgi:hypothetical protein
VSLELAFAMRWLAHAVAPGHPADIVVRDTFSLQGAMAELPDIGAAREFHAAAAKLLRDLIKGKAEHRKGIIAGLERARRWQQSRSDRRP